MGKGQAPAPDRQAAQSWTSGAKDLVVTALDSRIWATRPAGSSPRSTGRLVAGGYAGSCTPAPPRTSSSAPATSAPRTVGPTARTTRRCAGRMPAHRLVVREVGPTVRGADVAVAEPLVRGGAGVHDPA